MEFIEFRVDDATCKNFGIVEDRDDRRSWALFEEVVLIKTWSNEISSSY